MVVPSDEQPIQFYSTKGEYGFLSNFFAAPFEIEGKAWKNVESYFQAQKFAGSEHEEAIRLVASPMVAARMGRSRSRPLRQDWDAVKLDILRHALRAKFEQNLELRDRLLSTGTRPLIEHTKRDRFYGDGGDGSGANWLGRLLEETRERLRSVGQ